VGTPLPPEIEPLAFLLGTWRGTGIGEFPTVESFAYEEELEFGNVGKAYVTFRQRTWVVQGDERLPSHMEFSFWRPRRVDQSRLSVHTRTVSPRSKWAGSRVLVSPSGLIGS
jgi:hypothetical protein